MIREIRETLSTAKAKRLALQQLLDARSRNYPP